MKIAALLSGGKDSCYNMLQCVKHHHEIVCLVNLLPENTSVNELDSFMYQTVGHTAIDAIGEAMELPLLRYKITGKCVTAEMEYTPQKGDEVEDLYAALKDVKERFPEVEGISSGAILSNYQRERVENVCNRLNLKSVAYLWEQEQRSLLRSMLSDGIVALVIKTATMGLDRRHIGKTLNELEPYLLHISDIYGCNPCGEGGEYETFTIDCPLFHKRIVIDQYQIVVHSDAIDAPVILYVPTKWHLEHKSEAQAEYCPETQIEKYPIVENVEPDFPQKARSPIPAFEKVLERNSLDPEHILEELVNRGKNSRLHVIHVISPNLPDFPPILDALAAQLGYSPALSFVQSSTVSRPFWGVSSGLAGNSYCWFSLSNWVPPGVFRYSPAVSAGRLISVPFVLPVPADGFKYGESSVSAACVRCADYDEKTAGKVHRDSVLVLGVTLFNERFEHTGVEYARRPAIIRGEVEEIIGGCSMQVSSRGYFKDSYNDDCEEEMREIGESGLEVVYGEFVSIAVFGLKSGFSKVPVDEKFKNVFVKVYFDPDDEIDFEAIYSRVSFILDLTVVELSGKQIEFVPVRKLELSIRNRDFMHYPIVIEVDSFN